MSDPLRKVFRGERVVHRAATENALRETARETRARRFGGGQAPPRPAEVAGTVLVKNVSGMALARFDVLGLGSPLYGPDDNLAEWKDRPCFQGETPDGHRAFAVLQEPLAEGAIGRAIAHGFTIARLVVGSGATGYHFADLDDGTYQLAAVEEGPAEILWKPAGTGTHIAAVRISSRAPA